jgi:hypothetical protein
MKKVTLGFLMKKITLWKNRAIVIFLREYFQTMIKIISIQIRFKNTISNFNQDGYYTNCHYPYPSIYQQPNPAVSPCHTYNFFGGSSTYDQSNF